MGIFEDSSAFWELVSATSSVIPEDARNISQPRELRFLSSVPLDVNLAADAISDPKIKQVQEWLKTGPFGASPYTGPIDGTINSNMVSSLISVSNKIKIIFPEESYLTLTTGDKVLFSNFNKALELQKKHLSSKNKENQDVDKISQDEKDKSSKELDISLDIPKSNEINAYRAIFGLSLNNKLDHELIVQFKNLEQKISQKLNDQSVIGMIYDPIAKKIKTSPEDIKESIKLIEKL